MKIINHLKHPLLYIYVFFFGFTGSTFSQEKITQLITKDSIKKLLQSRTMRNKDSVTKILFNKNYVLTPFSKYLLHYELGKIYREKSDFIKAVKHHQISREIAKNLRDTVAIVKSSNQLGTNFRRVGALADASKAHFYALKTAENYSNKNTREGKKLLSYSLNGIGNIYKSLNNGKEAFDFFSRSVSIDKELKNYLGLAINHVTMGSIMEHQDSLNKAYKYYKKAIYYDSLANSKTGIAICHNRIGQLLLRQGKTNEALNHYEIANTILEKKKDIWNQLKTKTDIAWIYIQQKKYTEAHQLLKKVEKIASQQKIYNYLGKIHYLLGMLYVERQQYKEAANSYDLCISYRDSLKHIAKEQKALDVRVNFEREMSEQRIQSLNEINIQEKYKKRMIVISGTIIVILLIGLLIISYYLFMSQRKRNNMLKETNAVRDKIFSIISHDLKAPAIAQKIALESLKPEIDTLEDKQIKRYYSAFQDNAENLLNIIKNLMDWASVQTNRIKYNPKAIDIIPVIIREMQLYQISAQQKQVSIDVDLPKSCIIVVDKQMISIVIRNLINNAVKFTKSGGNVFIQCRCEIHESIISIADTGVGMTRDQINALYSPEQRIQVNFGTKGEKGTGLGLILCKDLLERNGSRLLIESEEKKGTHIHFSLKKA